ncbi:MAG: hypothetical protein IPO00_11435 [Betaproteobacteria bacterium]|nr:hypothetical protein [Betaproteobacteria bacterium]
MTKDTTLATLMNTKPPRGCGNVITGSSSKRFHVGENWICSFKRRCNSSQQAMSAREFEAEIAKVLFARETPSPNTVFAALARTNFFVFNERGTVMQRHRHRQRRRRQNIDAADRGWPEQGARRSRAENQCTPGKKFSGLHFSQQALRQRWVILRKIQNVAVVQIGPGYPWLPRFHTIQ